MGFRVAALLTVSNWTEALTPKKVANTLSCNPSQSGRQAHAIALEHAAADAKGHKGSFWSSLRTHWGTATS